MDELDSINRLLLTLKSDDLVKTIFDGDKKFGNDSKILTDINSNYQKQPPEVFHENRCS